MFQAVRMMNGMDYTSLGLTKLCLQPGIQFRLQAGWSNGSPTAGMASVLARAAEITRRSVPEKKNEDNDGDRHAKQPQKNTSAHFLSSDTFNCEGTQA
jgi:hypothetical protein